MISNKKLIDGYYGFKRYPEYLRASGLINAKQAREIEKYPMEIMTLNSALEDFKKGKISYMELLGLYSDIKGDDASRHYWWEI